MNRAADVLGSRDLLHGHFEGIHIDFDFGYIRAPGVDRIGVTRIAFIVPFDLGRRSVSSVSAKLTELRDVLASDFIETRKILSVCAEFASNYRRLRRAKAFGDKVQQLLFDSRAASCTTLPTTIVVREATVGPLSGTRLSIGILDLDLVEFEPELIGHDLAEDSAHALADFGGARQNSWSALGGDFDTGVSLHSRFAAAGEARAVQKE